MLDISDTVVDLMDLFRLVESVLHEDRGQQRVGRRQRGELSNSMRVCGCMACSMWIPEQTWAMRCLVVGEFT